MRTTLFSTITTLLLMFFVCSCGVPSSSAPEPEEPQIENIEEPETPPEEWTAPEPDEGQMTTAEPDEEPIIKGTGKGQKNNEEPVVTSETPKEEETVPPKKESDLEQYLAILKAPEIMYENKTEEMTIELKDPNYGIVNNKKNNEKHVVDSTFIPANAGQYVKITPNAPNFIVTPVSPQDAGCIKIHPSGSIVKFNLTPIEGKRGKVNVSASIALYEDEDCACKNPVLKGTNTVSVDVKIGGFWDRVFDIFRDHLYTFLGSFFTLLAAIVLFKIRKKSKIDEKD